MRRILFLVNPKSGKANIKNGLLGIVDIFTKHDQSELERLHFLEEETDRLTKELAKNHYTRITNDECTPELTSFYSELITELERVADHLTNVGYSIVDPTGDEI